MVFECFCYIKEPLSKWIDLVIVAGRVKSTVHVYSRVSVVVPVLFTK